MVKIRFFFVMRMTNEENISQQNTRLDTIGAEETRKQDEEEIQQKGYGGSAGLLHSTSHYKVQNDEPRVLEIP